MYIFSNDYKGCESKDIGLNLAHMRTFYLGAKFSLYFEHTNTYDTLTFDTQENATIAYQSIVGMVKTLQ